MLYYLVGIFPLFFFYLLSEQQMKRSYFDLVFITAAQSAEGPTWATLQLRSF